ncbi:MAG: hypothetical protein ABW188_00880, partial [Rhodococcus fascians]
MVEIIDRPTHIPRDWDISTHNDNNSGLSNNCGPHGHRFPKPRFPTGIVTGPAILLVVSLIGAAGLLLLRTPAPDSIPASESQAIQADAQSTADRLNADIAASTQNLTAAAAPLTADLAGGSERALNRVGKATPGFDGFAIVDNTGSALATRGDAVPPAQTGTSTTGVVGGKLVTTIALSPTRSLVATRTPDLTVQPGQGRRLLLADSTGHVAAESGSKPTVADDLLDTATGRAGGGAPGVVVDENALHTSGFALDILDFTH